MRETFEKHSGTKIVKKRNFVELVAMYIERQIVKMQNNVHK